MVRAILVALGLLIAVACEAEQDPANKLIGPWQPLPFPLAGPILESVDRACRGAFPEFPQETHMVVVDARGGGRIDAHYVAPDGVVEATCWGMSVDEAARVEGGGGGTQFHDVEPPPLQPLEITNSGGYGSAESSVTLGRVGAGIVKVVILAPGLPLITSTLMNGWYLAWVPSDWPPGAKAVGLDALGQSVAEVAVP